MNASPTNSHPRLRLSPRGPRTRPGLRWGALLWLLFAAPLGQAGGAGAPGLPRSAPETQGVSPAAVLAFVESADGELDAMHSFMLVRHGRVVAEGWWAPYAPESPHELYSLSKSFTSTAVGLAVAEGKLSVDDEVLKFFPGDAPSAPSDNLKAMRVRDLLCMSTGQQDESPTAPDKMAARAFLAQPVPHKPGTHFKYNTPATYMLSALVQKTTGQPVLEYLQTRLFAPLGIENPKWGTSAEGVTLGGYGLRVRTEAIARFGQLYLQKGKWHGKQLLPAAWVEAATARQTSNGSNPKSDWDQGYGYQFWRCRHGAYRGDGAFGQFCIVLPAQDTVLAITSGLRDMQQVLNLVWDKLLPGLAPKRLPADLPARQQLARRLASLALPALPGAASSPVAARVSGKTFVFPANDQKLEAVQLQSSSSLPGATLTLRLSGNEHRLMCGQGAWQKGQLPFGLASSEPVVASGTWVTDDTYAAKVFAIETPHCLNLKLRFAGDELFYDAETNVAFGPTKQPQRVGRAQ
jgi:CubicO group peptidase (beta-lactamase class C family)